VAPKAIWRLLVEPEVKSGGCERLILVRLRSFSLVRQSCQVRSKRPCLWRSPLAGSRPWATFHYPSSRTRSGIALPSSKPASNYSGIPGQAREDDAARILLGWRSRAASRQVSGARRLGRNDLSWVENGHRLEQYSPMKSATILIALSLAATAPASEQPEDAVARFIESTLHVSSYKRAEADLNGDGLPETFVYVTDPSHCGSGGCTLVVLSSEGQGFRVVLRSTVTQLPIRLLATSTQGWRDIGVNVEGGGITRPHVARLRFDGASYPSNPTVAPAMPLTRPSGRVLIGP
jgi:hypothetical protein